MSVCPSVSLSITRRYCIETAKIVKPGRPTILDLHAKHYGNIWTGTALTGASDADGVRKNSAVKNFNKNTTKRQQLFISLIFKRLTLL